MAGGYAEAHEAESGLNSYGNVVLRRVAPRVGRRDILIELRVQRRYPVRVRPEQYHAKDIADLLAKSRIATTDDLKRALGTPADATVFRKLQALGCRSSYSHAGRYYTLDEIAEYDAWGLWGYRSVWFSRRGTLLDTAAALVEASDVGFYASELQDVLHVVVKDALAKLVREKRVAREKRAGRYLYLAAQGSQRRRQRAARRVRESTSPPGGALPHVEVLPDELKAAIVLFYSLLDERQRRLYAGLESLKMGHGGDRTMAALLGLDVGTVARGRRELLHEDVEAGRVRRRGGGRPKVEKKRRR